MESIYNLIPQSAPEEEKKSTYVSTHRERVSKEYVATKSPGKLFGTQKHSTDPKNFTRKGRGDELRKTASQGKTTRDIPKQTVLAPATEPRLPKEVRNYVPRHTEKPTLAPPTNKNFIKENAKEARANTKRRPSSGTPYKGTGKVPAYLTKRKEEMKQQQEMEHTLQVQAAQDTGRKRMSDEEKQSLLKGLRTNHAELQRTFLGLSVTVDTIPKKERKERIESRLSELEADITLLERGNEIWIEA
eukprot:m.207698 g.207698  ORF g.207698 m.207698 type:complete len:245 (+) comp18937_c0_seq1:283-1017(+)